MTAFDINKSEFVQLFPSSKVSGLVTKLGPGAHLVGIARRHVCITEQR